LNGKTPHPPSSVGHPLPGERAIIFGAHRGQEDRPLPSGEGLSFLARIAVRKTALSRGERVARCRRFHQPERAG
jgi:hypothetical protein